MFLKQKINTISSSVTGENENRDSGYGLKIQCEYLVEGDTRAAG